MGAEEVSSTHYGTLMWNSLINSDKNVTWTILMRVLHITRSLAIHASTSHEWDRVGEVMEWTLEFFRDYFIDSWIDAAGGWEQLAADGQSVLRVFQARQTAPQASRSSSRSPLRKTGASASTSASPSTQPSRTPSQESQSRRIPSMQTQPEKVKSSSSSIQQKQSTTYHAPKPESHSQLRFHNSIIDNANSEAASRVVSNTQRQWANSEMRAPATTKSSLGRVASNPTARATSGSQINASGQERSLGALASTNASNKSIGNVRQKPGSSPGSVQAANMASQQYVSPSSLRQSREANVTQSIPCESSMYHREASEAKARRPHLESSGSGPSREVTDVGQLQFDLNLGSSRDIGAAQSAFPTQSQSRTFRGVSALSSPKDYSYKNFASPVVQGLEEYLRAGNPCFKNSDLQSVVEEPVMTSTYAAPTGYRDFYSDEDRFQTPGSLSSNSPSAAQSNQLLMGRIRPKTPPRFQQQHMSNYNAAGTLNRQPAPFSNFPGNTNIRQTVPVETARNIVQGTRCVPGRGRTPPTANTGYMQPGSGQQDEIQRGILPVLGNLRNSPEFSQQGLQNSPMGNQPANNRGRQHCRQGFQSPAYNY